VYIVNRCTGSSTVYPHADYSTGIEVLAYYPQDPQAYYYYDENI